MLFAQPPETAGKAFWFILFFLYNLPRLLFCGLHFWDNYSDRKLNWYYLTRFVTLVLYLMIFVMTLIFILALPSGKKDNMREWRSMAFLAYCLPFAIVLCLEIYLYKIFKKFRNLKLAHQLDASVVI